MLHLVTGAAGFLGSHLCDRLLADGEEVIAIDNLSTGNIENIRHLVVNQRLDFRRHDVRQPFHFKVDRIWSLACPASPTYYSNHASETLETGILGTLNAVKLAKSIGARILLSSTSEVYGDPEVHPQTENYRGNVSHIGPRACYDTAKCASEAIVTTWARQHGVEVRVARIFNTYGPGMRADDGRVVSNFIVRSLANEPLQVHGDGSQTRSLCFVDDTVEALVRLMNSDYESPVNIGNPHEISVIALAHQIIWMTKSSSLIELRPLPFDDPRRRCPDIALAKKVLGWTPRVGLADGLARTIASFVQQYASAHGGLKEAYA